jgi:DNA topoisomerase-3
VRHELGGGGLRLLVLNGSYKPKTALGCSNWKNGCDFKIPYVMGEKKLTGKIIESILEKGKSTLQKDLKENNRQGDGYFKLQNNVIGIEWK